MDGKYKVSYMPYKCFHFHLNSNWKPISRIIQSLLNFEAITLAMVWGKEYEVSTIGQEMMDEYECFEGKEK